MNSFGLSWCGFWLVLACLTCLGLSCARLGLVVGHLGSNLGQLGSNLGPTWANLGPTWGQLAPTWGQAGINLDQHWGGLGKLGLAWQLVWLSLAPGLAWFGMAWSNLDHGSQVESNRLANDNFGNSFCCVHWLGHLAVSSKRRNFFWNF